MTVTIWHNPRCSKSRDTLALLEAEGIEPEIRLYLKDPPDAHEIRMVSAWLAHPVIDMVREGEPVFRELGLSRSSEDDLLIAAMADRPILIERPIVIKGEKAVIGRPPRRVLDIL